MSTEDLIFRLSQRPPRESRVRPSAVLFGAVVLSILIAMVISISWLKPRSDLGLILVLDSPVFFLKLAFSASVVLLAYRIVCDLSIPGRSVGIRLVVLIGFFMLAVALVLCLPAGQSLVMWRDRNGHTTLDCLWQIPVLAVPGLLILSGVVRRLGPTDLSRTGAYVGLLAGGIASLGYALHCSHESIAFVGIAYTLAVLETVILGAFIGPRILRWT